MISQIDQIHLVYAIQVGATSGIYYIKTNDGGETWEYPIQVFANSSANRMVDQPKVAVDGQGQVHVIWVENNYPETYPPIGIRYSSSPDGVAWSKPRSLADGPYSDPAILVVGDRDIHAVWSGTATDRFKFHTWSQDAGITWTDTWRNSELGGIQGSPALAADSLGRIYWLKVGTIFSLLGGAYPNPDCLHENIFEDKVWSGGSIIFNGYL